MLNEREYNLVMALVQATAEQARINVMLDLNPSDEVKDALTTDMIEGDDLIFDIWEELNGA